MRSVAVGIFLFMGLLSACKEPSSGSAENRQVARVGRAYLYEDELRDMMPPNLTGADSIRIREAAIQNWVKEQLMYRKAKESLSREEKDKEKQLEQYYNSLLRYEYEKKEVLSRLDTTIDEAEIEEYYRDNQKNFELKRNIIRLLYVKLLLDAPEQEKVKKWVAQPEGEGVLDSLREYSELNAVNYTLDPTQWFYFSQITKEVPIIESYSPEHFVRNNKYVELKDSEYLYLINILDKRIKDDIAPLQLERNKIINIIRNQRKVKLLKEMEREVMKEGLQKNLYEIY